MTERIDTRTEQELINEAIQVQDACNLSGVVGSFHRAIMRLWAISREDTDNKIMGRGTEWVNTHRVCRLYADKIRSLSGHIKFNDFNETYLTNDV